MYTVGTFVHSRYVSTVYVPIVYGRIYTVLCMIVLTYLPTYIHVSCLCVFTFTFYLEQSVWVLYKLACDEAEIGAAEYTTFCSLWN